MKYIEKYERLIKKPKEHFLDPLGNFLYETLKKLMAADKFTYPDFDKPSVYNSVRKYYGDQNDISIYYNFSGSFFRMITILLKENIMDKNYFRIWIEVRDSKCNKIRDEFFQIFDDKLKEYKIFDKRRVRIYKIPVDAQTKIINDLEDLNIIYDYIKYNV